MHCVLKHGRYIIPRPQSPNSRTISDQSNPDKDVKKKKLNPNEGASTQIQLPSSSRGLRAIGAAASLGRAADVRMLVGWAASSSRVSRRVNPFWISPLYRSPRWVLTGGFSEYEQRCFSGMLSSPLVDRVWRTNFDERGDVGGLGEILFQ
ncbi:hypothetical protein STAS_33270 [Striga asiatica]|uniref:Uncharacterized protein n=1 Tax=Striga asiatica TaxID=4170 RepID=A0A5A7RDL1_STRAF|nr:hypothetical protein STAS_33270 [Striga asiatica]